MSDTKSDLDAIQARLNEYRKNMEVSVLDVLLDSVDDLVAYARTLEAEVERLSRVDLEPSRQMLVDDAESEAQFHSDRAEAAEAERDQLRDTLELRSAAHNRLADEWGAEANRYEQYATGSSTPHELRSIAKTLRQNAAAVREAATLRVLDGDQRKDAP